MGRKCSESVDPLGVRAKQRCLLGIACALDDGRRLGPGLSSSPLGCSWPLAEHGGRQA